MHKDCKKEHNWHIPKAHGKWAKWLFALFGLFGLVWFLVRVIPKPSRATYPCMRVAAPLASSFVVWLLGLGGAAIAVRTAFRHFHKIRYIRAALCMLAAAVVICLGLIQTNGPPASAGLDAVNDPIGTARGYKPGRVAWVHDPAATDWEGFEPGNSSCWEPDHIDQAVVDRMMSRALRWLTSKPTDAQAWDALFRYFNMQRRGEDEGYQETEKIAIKINLTLCHVSGSSNPPNRLLNRYLDKAGNTNPQMVMALLRQLVNKAKVPEENISVGDTVTFFPKQWYDYLWQEFPNVHYLDHYPYEDPETGYVATPVQFSGTDFHWSTPDANETVQDYLPSTFADAHYFINFSVLKSHERAGITVSAKNHFGSLFRSPPGRLQNETYAYYNIHNELPCGGGTVTGNYWPLVDLMGHENLGGKTLIHLIDGLFGGQGWDGTPHKWDLAPFNNDWPSSLFASQDAVAIDSVAYDFLVAEWPQDVESSACGADGAEDYLHEAALAHDPPSGTPYDPQNPYDPGNTLSALDSLGVHEHWNNAIEKQYTRNLGTGDGIELTGSDPGVDTPPGDFNEDEDVDGRDISDFAVFYANENPRADLNNDNVVDAVDVGKFAEYFGETG
jgi:hypothetical protein